MKASIIDKEKYYLIYGLGGYGIRLYNLLKSHECAVLGFVDKRSDKIKDYNGARVYSLKEAGKEIENKENIIALITIKNVYAHIDVANGLFRMGFNYIIYKPISILKGYENVGDRQIDAVYETLIEKNSFALNLPVPFYEKTIIRLQDRLVIEETGQAVKVWMPVELLFNYKNAPSYPGINMPLFFPIVDLYKAFLGLGEIPYEEAVSNYLLYCQEWLKRNNSSLTIDYNKSAIESRINIFTEMERLAETQINFFIKNAPEAEWEKSKFYLVSSGRNRVSYLIAKGFRYVPVKISKTDYEKWIDKKQVEQVEKELNENQNKMFFAPMPNPLLLDCPVCFPDYQKLFLTNIASSVTKSIYLASVKEECNMKTIDFDKVENEKNKITVINFIEDDGIAQNYFNNIGIHVQENIPFKNIKNIILLFDSRNNSCRMKEAVLNTENNMYCIIFDGIKSETFLEIENSLKVKEILFQSVCKLGKIIGVLYERC